MPGSENGSSGSKSRRKRYKKKVISTANKEMSCLKACGWSAPWGITFGVVALLVSITTMILAIVVIIREHQTEAAGLSELVKQVYDPLPEEPPEELAYLHDVSSLPENWDSVRAKRCASWVGGLNIAKAVIGAGAIFLFWPTREAGTNPSSTQESLVWSFSVPCVVVYATVSVFILAHASGDGPLLSHFLTISIASEILIMVVGFMMLRFWHSKDDPQQTDSVNPQKRPLVDKNDGQA